MLRDDSTDGGDAAQSNLGYEIYAKVSLPFRESSESSENYVKVVKIT